MKQANILALLIIYHLQLPIVLSQGSRKHPECEAFTCGKLGTLIFPFTTAASGRPAHCGFVLLDHCDGDPTIQFSPGGISYKVDSISQGREVVIRDSAFQDRIDKHDCQVFNNLTFPVTPYVSFSISSNQTTLMKCNSRPDFGDRVGLSNYTVCNHVTMYYSSEANEATVFPPLPSCSIIQLPKSMNTRSRDVFRLLNSSYAVRVRVSRDCFRCFYGGGMCQVTNKGEFYCSGSPKDNSWRWKLGLGIGITVLAIILILLFLLLRRFRGRSSLSRSYTSKEELEAGTLYCGVSVFSYRELEAATKKFDSEKQLGDGGFGAVYYGKLRDGREVAVKRLYEHNYRRMEQFLNEIKILTRLRHKNLVSLYGSTSRKSRELLLVYEYIPNGTVADHLHGDRAKLSPLSWHTRMSIAIDTASALAYLHASDVIHRDVKTDNLLLDSNFCVKVADFGLSRLFPIDVTHVSTAPQGTAGYVDPDYHQCYQLTEKSDVYSFGVVLMELVSSLPAVDTNRERHEINLSRLATEKVEKKQFDKLIDPFIITDEGNKRKATFVAELGFRCLQLDKDKRPFMEEVLEELKRIQGEDYRMSESKKQVTTLSAECAPLRNTKLPTSPDTVTEKWVSSSSTASYASA